MSPPAILFVHNMLQPFVAIDLNLLRERYSVQEWFIPGRRIRLAETLRAVHRADAVFCWFASWHSFVPVIFARILRRPAVVVVGGYDTARMPEAGYGSQRGGLRRLVARSVMRNAALLIAFSKSAQREAIENAGADPCKTTVLYLGVSGVDDMPPASAAREQVALTVGGVWRENLLRKGILPFVRASRLLPDVNFVHVGRWFDDSIAELRRAAGPNVTFLGYLPEQALSEQYQRASVYVQASLHEGFGMSVAEAMLAGCIPVVTRAGALPEVVGDAGIYLDSNTPDAIAHGISVGLTSDQRKRQQARVRIVTAFPIENRRRALHSLLDQLLAGHR